MQVVERTVAGAEVVHEEGDSEPAQPPQDFTGGLNIIDKAVFGHFQAKLAAVNAGTLKDGFDMIRQPYARELPRGQVDADAERSVSGIFVAPFSNLIASFGESPVSDGQSQPGFLGKGNEVLGKD